jgi:hypothetical protein
MQKERGRKTPLRQASPLPSRKRKPSRVYTQSDSPSPQQTRYISQTEETEMPKAEGGEKDMFENASWRKDLTSKIINANLYYNP